MKWQDIIKTKRSPYERDIEERIRRHKEEAGYREKRKTERLARRVPTSRSAIGIRTGVGATRDEARVIAYFSQLKNILDELNISKTIYPHFVDQILGKNATGQRERALQEYAAGLQERELNLDALDFLYEAIKIFEAIPPALTWVSRGHVDTATGAQVQRQEWPQEYQQHIQDVTEEE